MTLNYYAGWASLNNTTTREVFMFKSSESTQYDPCCMSIRVSKGDSITYACPSGGSMNYAY